MVATRAAVPKAAVNENSNALTAEDKVRVAGQVLVAAPSLYAVGAEDERQPQLRVFVSARADGGHDLGAFPVGEHIDHCWNLIGLSGVCRSY
jgi:hypothetical protein